MDKELGFHEYLSRGSFLHLIIYFLVQKNKMQVQGKEQYAEGAWPREGPVTVMCATCNQQRQTTISTSAGSHTYILMLIICLLGGGCFCCLIPLCMDSVQDVNHKCSVCDTHLGTGAFKLFGKWGATKGWLPACATARNGLCFLFEFKCLHKTYSVLNLNAHLSFLYLISLSG